MRTRIDDQRERDFCASSCYPKLISHKLELLFSNYKWYRKLTKGYWERWWVDCTCSYIWMKFDKPHVDGQRPAGCEMWKSGPAPVEREFYG